MQQGAGSRQVRRAMTRMWNKSAGRARRALPNQMFFWQYANRDPETGAKVPLPWASGHLYETCLRLAYEWAGHGAARPTRGSKKIVEGYTIGICPMCYARYRQGR